MAVIEHLHYKEIDARVLADTHLEQAALTCESCGVCYTTGDEWPCICRCGGELWTLAIFFDHRDLNLPHNHVVI